MTAKTAIIANARSDDASTKPASLFFIYVIFGYANFPERRIVKKNHRSTLCVLCGLRVEITLYLQLLQHTRCRRHYFFRRCLFPREFAADRALVQDDDTVREPEHFWQFR